MQKKKYYANLYPKEIYDKLEFDKILEKLEGYCQSPLGREYVENIRFMTERDEIEKQLRQTHEFLLLLNTSVQPFPSENYLELKQEIHLLGIQNSVLNEQQIFKVFQVLETTSSILYFFRQKDGENQELYPELAALTNDLDVEKDLLNAIKYVIDENGKIKSSASSDLARIRNNMGRKYQELDSRFRSAINEFKRYGYLEDNIESIRNGRRVLAVKSSHKRKIKGMIVDESSTGRITYIEPEATLQANNELFELQQEEKREIYRILQRLTTQLVPYIEPLKAYQSLLGKLDFIRAKAKLGHSMNGIMPMISGERITELFNAYHPYLFLLNKQQKKKTVPLSIRLSIADRILVISGPNAGGKSVALKTMGLLQVMLQTGMLLPVDEGSMMSIFKRIFVDIGDEQSLENDLSTYSSRLHNMRYFTEHADGKTMVLIDEFGSGTDPKFGGAIAEAILEDLNKKHVYGVITTHYSNIKIFATQNRGLINGSMAFDKKNMRPLYRLEVGQPGSSFAFEIADNCGLSEKVLEAARQKVGEKYLEFDEILSSLQAEKAELSARLESVVVREKAAEAAVSAYEAKRKDITKKRQSILLEAEQEALNLVNDTNKKYNKILLDLSKQKGEKKVVKKIQEEIEKDRTKSRTKIEKMKDVVLAKKSKGILEEGASVQLRTGGKVGTVVELRNNRALVAFGELKTTVKTKELVVVEKQEKKERAMVHFDTLTAAVEFSSNIDVRGMRREEALSEVERLLDKGIMASAARLTIIHGRGDGILRRSIRQYLRKSKFVVSVGDEEPQYGGDGISIVELAS